MSDKWLVSAGDYQRIYDPSVGEGEAWYINDHCFIRGEDGLWHMFGITRQEPSMPREERNLAHATSPDLLAPQWEKQPFALSADFDNHGEVHLWAPHVVRHDGLYYMYYCAGAARATRDEIDHEGYRIHLAVSPDLWTWTRHEANPMLRDGFHARDPMILRHDGQWVMYYTATSEPAGGNHIVAACTSDDLVNWTGRRTVFTHERKGRYGGPTESPFVVKRGDWYYLFIGPSHGEELPGWDPYRTTDVYRSRDPLNFEGAPMVGRVQSHAAEVVQDTDGSWYVSHCGWGQGGLFLAPLKWAD